LIDTLKFWNVHSNSEKHITNLSNFEKKAESKKAKNIEKLLTKKTSKLQHKATSSDLNKNPKMGNNFFAAYEEESESEESNLDEQKKQNLKENVFKIINQTFEDKDVNKKNLLSSIPKGFFDDPSKDQRYRLELEEEKEEEQKKMKYEIEKKKIEDEKKQKEYKQELNTEEKESDEDTDDIALNEEISAMIECAEFLGNLAKKEKKKKYRKINLNDNNNAIQKSFEGYDKDINNQAYEENFNLLNKKRKKKFMENEDKIINKNSIENSENLKDSDEENSINLDQIINTDFRNID